jgi:hypothetical protein
MPNALAYLMLLIWPLVSVMLFRRLPAERAIIWCILGGYLVLPPLAEFDLPLVPDMDKHAIPSIMAFVLCVFILKKPVPIMPRSWVARILVIIFMLGTIPTVLNNTDPLIVDVIHNSYPIQITATQLPGLTLRDVGSVVINQIILLLPFFLARQYLSTDHGMRELLLALVVGALAYSLPALFEVRFSPQLNIWIYGFFQHDFGQMIRQGGFRPIVFLQHGLWVAFFFTTACMACAALGRHEQDRETRVRYAWALVYLFWILWLCKSLASLLYGLAFVPFILLMPIRWQVHLAVLLVLFGVLYPMLRNLHLVPLDAILAQAAEISAERTQSLDYRFRNEEILLERAEEKPIFGWGVWGRNLIRDVQTGELLTIPDGRWIITFGTFGWVGYVGEMGLLALPILLLWWRARGNTPASPQAAAVALILAVTMVDMLINATLIHYTWMCAGAVLGYVERLKEQSMIPAPEIAAGASGPVIGSGHGPRRPRTLF